MFGASSTSPFASPPAGGAATPFGAPATGGFGAASPAPFGASTTPGTTASTPGGFGTFGAAPAPAGGGFGTFGAAPAPAASAFGTPAAGAGTTPGFGTSTAPTPFGAPAPAPGGLFGAPAPAPAGGGLFGGGAATSTGGFGTTTGAATPGGGGLFGGGAATTGATGGFGTTTNTAAGGFGATTSAFGASTSATPAFGAAPAPASGGLFGGGAAPAPAFGAPATSAFGAPAPAPGGLFGGGAAAPAGGGLFGGGAAKPGTLATPYVVTSKSDGSTSINIQAITAMPQYEGKSFEELRFEDYQAGNKGSMGQPGAAGAPAAGGFGSTGAFGAPAPAPGGLFGAPAPAPAFGAPATTGAFGAPAPAPGATGAFGSPAPAPAFGAPAPAPGFSFGAAPAPAAGGFGSFGAKAPAPGGGLFGASSPAPAPAAGGLFGSSTPAPAPGGLFGAPAPAPSSGGLFGAPAPAPAGGGLFGAPAPAPAAGGLFGAPAPAPAGGGLFGAPAAKPPGGGLFGAPAPAPATGGLLGAPSPAPAAGGLFGASAPAAPAGGLFGSPAPAPAGGGLFGAPAPAAPAGGLFGAPAPAATAGGLFGAPAPAPTGGLFGAPATAPMGAAAGVGAATVPPPTADALLAQQLAAVENQKKDLALLEAWRGKSPGGSSVIPASLSERDSATSYGPGGRKGKDESGTSTYAASSAALLSYQAAPRSAARIRPRGFGPLKSPVPVGQISGGGGSPMLSPDAFLGSSAKRLVIKPGSLTPKPKMRLLLTNGDGNDSGDKNKLREPYSPNGVNLTTRLETSPAAVSPAADQSNRVGGEKVGPNSVGALVAVADSDDRSAATPAVDSAQTAEENGYEASPMARTSTPNTPAETPREKTKLQSSLKKKTPQGNGSSYDFYLQVVGSPDSTAHQQTTPVITPKSKEQGASPSKNQQQNGHYAPKLTKNGYSMTPSFDDLKEMSEADLAAVSNFCVERDGYGSVAWDGAVDVRGIDLDRVVSIEHKDVAVYDAEEAEGTKPPVGSKLNRPAVITMYKVFPKSGSGATPDAKSKFERKIAKSTKKMGAEFISYDAESGIWKFRVRHFSRYKMVEDSDESDNESSSVGQEEHNLALVPAEEHTPDFESAGRGGHPGVFMAHGGIQEGSTKTFSGGMSRIRAPISEDEDMSERTEDESITLMSEGEISEGENETKLIQAGDAAYAAIVQARIQQKSTGTARDEKIERINHEASRDENAFYADEGESSSAYLNEVPDISQNKLPYHRGKSISAEIAGGISTSSATDFGLRMGRSFRVAWRPDGSLLCPRTLSDPSPFTFGRNSVFVQKRPILAETKKPTEYNALENNVRLLETHSRNDTRVESKHDGCPLFSLPIGSNSSGSKEHSQKALISLLEDYAKTTLDARDKEGESEKSMILFRAFSLIAILFGQEDSREEKAQSKKSTLPDRRFEALSRWLREATSHDVSLDITTAQRKGDPYGAIFAALSGGDVSKAASIALESGHMRLSLLITSCGQQSVSDLETQMHHWHETGASSHMPSSLIRVYSLLSGNLQLEENLFKNGGVPEKSAIDWRRRFGMKLWASSGSAEKQNVSINSIVHSFKADVEAEVVPFPVPRYMSISDQGNSSVECILFRLLRLYGIKDEESMQHGISFTDIVSPLGHTCSMHDFSVSFHIAAVLCALGCVPLPALAEQERLIDSYCAQLVSAGLWQWAVYTSLCFIGGVPESDALIVSRVQKARNLIAQHYNEGDPTSSSRRSFLEKLGIPICWFEETLADRCVLKGDAIGHVNHLMHCSVEDATDATEELILPYLLFNGGNDSQKLLQTLDVLRNDDDSPQWNTSLCGAIYDYLSVTKEISQLSKLSADERSHLADQLGLLELKITEVEKNLSAIEKKSQGLKGKSPKSRCSGVKQVPRSVYIAEAMSGLSFLRLQLRALRSGFSILDSDRRLKLASQLVSLSFPEEQTYSSSFLGTLASEGTLRGHGGLV